MHLTNKSKWSIFGCEGYLEEGDEQCKNTNSLISVDLFDDNDDKEAESIFNKTKCDICGSAMDGYIIDEKRKLHICANSPICSGTKLEKENSLNLRMMKKI